MTRGQFCDRVMNAFTENGWTIEERKTGYIGEHCDKNMHIITYYLGGNGDTKSAVGMMFTLYTPILMEDDEFAIELYKQFLASCYESSREKHGIFDNETWDELIDARNKINNEIEPVYKRYMQQSGDDEEEDTLNPDEALKEVERILTSHECKVNESINEEENIVYYDVDVVEGDGYTMDLRLPLVDWYKKDKTKHIKNIVDAVCRWADEYNSDSDAIEEYHQSGNFTTLRDCLLVCELRERRLKALAKDLKNFYDNWKGEKQ